MLQENREQSGIDVKLEFILRELDEIKAQLEKKYVSQDEFKPVKNLVYGLVSIILTLTVTALIALVITK